MPNLPRIPAPLPKYARDEEKAVAGKRVGFGAEESHGIATAIRLQSGYSGQKALRPRERTVEHMPGLIIELRLLRPPTEEVPHKRIPDPVWQRIAERRPIEVRAVVRNWLTSDVHQHLNLMSFEKARKRLQSVVGVADREQREVGLGHLF
jgi:hypothetical protein